MSAPRSTPGTRASGGFGDTEIALGRLWFRWQGSIFGVNLATGLGTIRILVGDTGGNNSDYVMEWDGRYLWIGDSSPSVFDPGSRFHAIPIDNPTGYDPSRSGYEAFGIGSYAGFNDISGVWRVGDSIWFAGSGSSRWVEFGADAPPKTFGLGVGIGDTRFPVT